MGLRDMLTVRTDGPASPDYATHGEEPGEHGLTASAAHVMALETAEAARDLAPSHHAETTPRPIVGIEPVENATAEVQTFVIQPGDVQQVLHRDPLRATAEINNLSNVNVALCVRQSDAVAASALGGAPFPPARSISLPHGGTVPRKLTHGAPMWVVVDPNAGGAATIDLIFERKHTARP